MISFICSATEEQSDQEFMIHVYQTYGRLMFRIAKALAPEDREDIVQESLLRLIAKVDLLKTLPPHRLASYVGTTTKHTGYSLLRKRSREGTLVLPFDGEIDGFPAPGGSTEDRALQEDGEDQLSPIWSALSLDDRLVLSGRYILRQTDEELAEDLGCSPDSVRMKLTRARRRAQALVKKQQDAEGN